MKKRQFCHQCGGRVRPTAKFCNHCGIRFTKRSSGSSVPETSKRNEVLPKQEPSESRIAEILPNDTERLDAHLTHVKQQLRNLRAEIQTINQEYHQCRQIRIREQSEVDELKKLSWASFSAKLKGNMKEKLKAEEMDVVRAAAKEKLVLEQLQELRRTEQELIDERGRLINEIKRLRSIAATPMTKQERTQDSDFAKHEEDLEDLGAGREFLQKARIDLEEAISELKSAKTASTREIGGEKVFDLMERSRISSAQHHVSNAEANIRQARLRLSSVNVPETPIEMPSLMLDRFFNSLFGDFLSHQKINEGLWRCEQSRTAVISTIEQVDEAFNHLQRRIIEIDKESEVLQRVILPEKETSEIISSTEEVSVQLEEPNAEVAEDEMETVTSTEESVKESLAAEIMNDVLPVPSQAIAGSSFVEGIGIAEEKTEESLDKTPSSIMLPSIFLEDLERMKYRFRSLEISENKEEATAIFFSDKPQEMHWTRREDGKFVVNSNGKTSANWNAALTFTIAPLDRFSWAAPYEGLDLSSENLQVVQKILKTSRVAEKLRSSSLLKEAYVKVSEKQTQVQLVFSDVPDVRDSVDLARDLILALELVRV
jgi:hypothetical protein